MRLWHKLLIELLPRQQLLGQWRELSALASNINKKGNPNHILVNKIMDYPIYHFISYSFYVQAEIYNRGYKTTISTWKNIESVCAKPYYILSLDDVYVEWHNKDYLQICYWNLYEKFLCGGITEQEWGKIVKQFKKTIDKTEKFW